MLYESDIEKLISKWENSVEPIFPSDCINDLRTLINRTHDEEEQACYDPMDGMTPEEMKEYFDDMEADYWIEQDKIDGNIYYN